MTTPCFFNFVVNGYAITLWWWQYYIVISNYTSKRLTVCTRMYVNTIFCMYVPIFSCVISFRTDCPRSVTMPSTADQRHANGAVVTAASGGGGLSAEADERLRAALQEMDDIMKGKLRSSLILSYSL